MRQFKDLIGFIKDLLNNQSKKRVVENAVIIIIIGIIVIIAGGSFFKKSTPAKDKPKEEVNKSEEVSAGVSSTENKTDIEKRMETLLSTVEGAGKVEVMITYVSGKELVPAYDTKETENDTQEKDSGGGTRNNKQYDSENKVVYSEGQEGKKPVILKELQPSVRGVVVVADGATDSIVKDSLCRAVQVLLDVDVYKIQVLERSR